MKDVLYNFNKSFFWNFKFLLTERNRSIHNYMCSYIVFIPKPYIINWWIFQFSTVSKILKYCERKKSLILQNFFFFSQLYCRFWPRKFEYLVENASMSFENSIFIKSKHLCRSKIKQHSIAKSSQFTTGENSSNV